jgi:hypothetical protein
MEADCHRANRDHPLVLYIFTTDTKVRDRGLFAFSFFSGRPKNLHKVGQLTVFDRTQSGACLANDLVIHGGCESVLYFSSSSLSEADGVE